MKDKNGNEIISLENWLQHFHEKDLIKREKEFLNDSYNQRIPLETIADFWNEFISSRLLDPEIVIHFNEELYKYMERPDAVFAIRAYSGKDSDNDSDKETRFRRGYYTETDDHYSFFYTDNSFAYYFYRMAYDGLYPSAEELFRCMTEHKFYYKFRIRGDYAKGKEDKYATIFPIGEKDPKVTSNYKLAHIYDQGQNYNFYGSIENREYFCDKYFPRGSLIDWKECSNNQYIRTLNIPECDKQKAKEWIKAQFLRFVSPMNYFLAPKGPQGAYNLFWPTESTISMDIGEDKNLLSYVQQKMHEIYGDYYNNFLDKIFIDQDTTKEDGTKKINIIYSSKTLYQEYSTPKKTKKSSPQINMDNISTAQKFSTYSYNGNVYNQRKLCLEIIKDYVRQNPNININQLKQVWNFKGMRQAILNENELSAEQIKRKRYNLDNSDKLFLIDNSVAVVSTQWTESKVDDFIEIAKKLGFVIQKNE
ncbi:hypothetical protein [Treponema sp.]|uniref:hypothetical protein n=1 Tax=Treponema sp. TaxID=166 RepID=UPI003890D542